MCNMSSAFFELVRNRYSENAELSKIREILSNPNASNEIIQSLVRNT